MIDEIYKMIFDFARICTVVCQVKDYVYASPYKVIK